MFFLVSSFKYLSNILHFLFDIGKDTAELVRQLERVKDKDVQDIPLVLVGLEAEKEGILLITYKLVLNIVKK